MGAYYSAAGGVRNGSQSSSFVEQKKRFLCYWPLYQTGLHSVSFSVKNELFTVSFICFQRIATRTDQRGGLIWA